MYFDSLHAVLAMEGHGVYVWLAYGMTLAVIAAVIIAPLRRRHRLLQQLAMEQRRSRGAGSVGES
jgi:heme exporter protein D